eukprot:3411139-Prorocentrum_lima.AAC.1
MCIRDRSEAEWQLLAAQANTKAAAASPPPGPAPGPTASSPAAGPQEGASAPPLDTAPLTATWTT